MWKCLLCVHYSYEYFNEPCNIWCRRFWWTGTSQNLKSHCDYWCLYLVTGKYPWHNIPDSKVHGANMGPIWGRRDPGGPHVGPWILLSGIANTLSIFHFVLVNLGRDETAIILQLSNACSWMKMYEFRLRFHWSLFPRWELKILQHWFR